MSAAGQKLLEIVLPILINGLARVSRRCDD